MTDIADAAKEMVALFGDAAFFKAHQRAMDAMLQNDSDLHKFWSDVGDLLDQWKRGSNDNDPGSK